MKIVRFSDVAFRANTKEDRFNTDKRYYVGGEHIDSSEMIIEKRGVIAGSTIGPMFYCGFKSGDILFVTRNPHLRKCGVVDFDGICSEKTFVIQSKDNNVLLQEYLAIVMQSDDFWDYCEENKSGGVNYFINWSTLAEYEFPLPSLSEQKALAEKLWAAYEVKQSYLKMIKATQEMVQSQFIEMFKGDFPIERWEECLSITNGKKYDGEYQQSGTYPICGSGGIMGYGDQKLCQGKTVILGRKGNINSPIFMESEYWIVDTAFCLEVDKQKLHPKYFYYWCKQFDFTRYNKQGVLPSLTKNDLLKIEMPIPPMELQVRFVNIIEQADKSEFVGFKSQFIEMFGKTANRVSLSTLCDTFIDGDWIEAKDQSESEIRLIQTGNVGVGIFKDKGEKARYISEETFNRLNCTEVVEGDILISRLPDPVGRACIIPSGLGKTITAVDCTIIRLKDLILPKFFIAFTNTPDYAMQIKKVLSGTTRLRVSRTNLGNIKVPLPSIEEQLRFVSIAHQADKSEFELKKSIEAIDAVIKSLINS